MQTWSLPEEEPCSRLRAKLSPSSRLDAALLTFSDMHQTESDFHILLRVLCATLSHVRYLNARQEHIF